jgi:acetylornithine deacetylase/succinyl-diaminopimelate desuccinylase-like protein
MMVLFQKAEEEELNEKVDFLVTEYEKETGISSIYTRKNDMLMYRSRFPSLSIHGIEGAYSGPSIKTVIPSRVIGKFSIRLVPHQDPDKISKLVKNYIYEEFEKLPTLNKIKVNCPHGEGAWLGDIHHWNYSKYTFFFLFICKMN